MLIGIALLMLVPAAVGYYDSEPDAGHFLTSGAMAAAAGLVMVLGNRRQNFRIAPRQAFVLTTVTWLTVSMVSALPLVLIEHIDYSDAFFETMSGITTTGSTVLVGLDDMERSVLIWRSLLQWFGGVGFMIMAVALLPFLGVGGMRIFKSESSEWSNKNMPRIRHVAMTTAGTYVLLTVVCGAAYWVAGMTAFEAVNHAMATLSTGGFSTSDMSFNRWQSPAVAWVAVVFMVLGALPFIRYVQLLRGSPRSLWRDEQVRGLIGVLLVSIAVITAWRVVSGDEGLSRSLLEVAFNVVSVVTTTGFALGDFSAWGSFAVVAFLLLMFVGGCSGSTSGAIKIFRYQIAARLFGAMLARQIHPSGVFVVRYNGVVVDPQMTVSVFTFSFAFLAVIAVLAMLLALLGLDPMVSLSAAITAVANVGPGVGPLIGPAGNFAAVPDAAKWLLALGMLIGRLEIIAVLTLFSRYLWRG